MNKYLWSIFESGTTVLFQLLSLIILSHILSPSDYGVFGAMSIFISVGTMLADSGMGAALIKKDKPTEIDYSTLFCFNIGVSFLYYAMLFIISSYVAIFYDIRVLEICIKIYGLYIVIASLGLVQNLQLNRDLKLRELSIVTLFSNFIGLFVAIILGYSGYGYWSLIFQHLTFITSRVLLQFIYNKYIPQLQFSLVSFKEQFSYSVNLLGANILNVLYSNIVSLIIPKIGTLQQNGYYLQASKIQHVPMTIVSSVMDKVFFPILCRQHGDNFLTTTRKQIFYISSISSLVLITILLLSKPLIILLLGNEWLPIIIYLQILLLASYGMVYQYIIRSIFKAIGLTKKILKINLFQNLVGVICILMASYWGINVLLWGVVIVNLFVTAYYCCQVRESINYSLIHQLRDNCCMIVLFVVSVILVVI